MSFNRTVARAHIASLLSPVQAMNDLQYRGIAFRQLTVDTILLAFSVEKRTSRVFVRAHLAAQSSTTAPMAVYRSRRQLLLLSRPRPLVTKATVCPTTFPLLDRGASTKQRHSRLECPCALIFRRRELPGLLSLFFVFPRDRPREVHRSSIYDLEPATDLLLIFLLATDTRAESRVISVANERLFSDKKLPFCASPVESRYRGIILALFSCWSNCVGTQDNRKNAVDSLSRNRSFLPINSSARTYGRINREEEAKCGKWVACFQGRLVSNFSSKHIQ